MIDCELLEKAAKAAGYMLVENGRDVNGVPWFWCNELKDNWDPLLDDGDAFRLAVKLSMNICVTHNIGASARADGQPRWTDENAAANDDLSAATRRAIVRAAAAMADKKQT